MTAGEALMTTNQRSLTGHPTDRYLIRTNLPILIHQHHQLILSTRTSLHQLRFGRTLLTWPFMTLLQTRMFPTIQHPPTNLITRIAHLYTVHHRLILLTVALHHLLIAARVTEPFMAVLVAFVFGTVE